jgi:hypothetical protein
MKADIKATVIRYCTPLDLPITFSPHDVLPGCCHRQIQISGLENCPGIAIPTLHIIFFQQFLQEVLGIEFYCEELLHNCVARSTIIATLDVGGLLMKLFNNTRNKIRVSYMKIQMAQCMTQLAPHYSSIVDSV